MELDASLQLLFGLIATILTLSGLWFKRQAFKSKKRTINNVIHANDRPAACCYRRARVKPLLPLHTPHSDRRSMYLMELNLTQDWVGQHAVGWSIGQPRMHRIADT